MNAGRLDVRVNDADSKPSTSDQDRQIGGRVRFPGSTSEGMRGDDLRQVSALRQNVKGGFKTGSDPLVSPGRRGSDPVLKPLDIEMQFDRVASDQHQPSLRLRRSCLARR